MMHLVTGGSGSGKSEYGENLLVGKGPLVYVATMEPYGEEAKKRIERHRRMRALKGFFTVECYRNLKELEINRSKDSMEESTDPKEARKTRETKKTKERPELGGVLLECMSNLVANELYLPDGSMRDEDGVMEEILLGVENLRRQTDRLVIVTNELTADGIMYSKETKIYQRVLGKINQHLAGQADLVTEVVYGIPIKLE